MALVVVPPEALVGIHDLAPDRLAMSLQNSAAATTTAGTSHGAFSIGSGGRIGPRHAAARRDRQAGEEVPRGKTGSTFMRSDKAC
jgi:hypothetical protein